MNAQMLRINWQQLTKGWLYALVILLALGAIIVYPIYLWSGDQEPEPSTKFQYWIIAMIALTVFVIALGRLIRGRLLGALIDERNKMSLARFQLIIWTVIVISGLATAALWNNFATDAADPLAIGLPEELWWLLGISTTSLVGTSLVLNIKKGQAANEVEQSINEQQLGAQQEQNTPAVGAAVVRTEGTLVKNENPEQARLVDMFKGDEIGNALYLDIGKVQFFFFTIIIVLAYGTALGDLFLTTTGVVGAFPNLSESTVILLGISSASYVAYKGISHSASPTITPQVPAVVGMDIRSAAQAVQDAGLNWNILQEDSVQPHGQVLRSDPAVGTPLAPGATVTLIYSSGQP